MVMLEWRSKCASKRSFSDHVSVRCSGSEAQMHLANPGERVRPMCLEQSVSVSVGQGLDQEDWSSGACLSCS